MFPSRLGRYTTSAMPIKRRHRQNYNEPGHAHKLTFSCYKDYQFMTAERTCQWLVETLEETRVKWNFALWAYVFMPEHVHLIVHPRDPRNDIADIRKAIKSPVGRKAIKFIQDEAPKWLPKITRSRGEKTERLFWQSGGGYDRNVIESGTLMKMVDYIHMNPVRRGLVENPEEWIWSSVGFYLNGKEVPIVPDPIPPEWLDGADCE